MKKVTVYSKDYCPYCTRAKALLQSKNIPFEEVSIEGKPELQQEIFSKSGFRTVPQIFIEEECLGGYDQLVALEQAGDLMKKVE